MVTKKKPGTAIMRWDEELAKAAAAQAASEKASQGSFFSFKSGQLSYQGTPIKGNTVDVIVLDFIHENQWYEDPEFDSDNPKSPSCYAFGRSEEDMAPHVESGDKQNSQCEGCPQNVFGSAKKGKGKACKNTRRLAVIPADSLELSIEDSEVGFMRLPVTSCKGWGAYVNKLRDVVKRPTWAVVTNIEVVPDQKNQLAVLFSLRDKIDPAYLPALKDRAEAIAKSIEFPYPKNVDRPNPSKGRSAASKAAASGHKAKKAKF